MTDRTTPLDMHVESARQMFAHPRDVVDDPGLSIEDKRALLASWASDANAVPHVPSLRQLPDGSIVKLDDILSSLKALDARGGLAGEQEDRLGLWWQRPFKRRARLALRNWPRRGGRDDDDDDPPPCPAYAAPRPRAGGGATFAIPESLAA